MRDEMTFVERLQNDLRDVRWPEPAVLRERARRRRRRAMVGTATAVLVLAAGPVIAGVGLGGPPAVAPPQNSQSAYVEIPHEVLVQPTDLTAMTDPPLGQAGVGELVQIDKLLPVCLEEQGRAAYWEPSRYSRSQTLLRASADGARRPADVLLSQDVYRIAPERVAGFFNRLDEMLAPCANWRSTGDVLWGDRIARAEADHRWEVTDRDFAGDEAMLIRHTITATRNLETGATREPAPPDTTAVLRVGDLVTVLTLTRDAPDPELRRVATIAAQRLCLASNPPC